MGPAKRPATCPAGAGWGYFILNLFLLLAVADATVAALAALFTMRSNNWRTAGMFLHVSSLLAAAWGRGFTERPILTRVHIVQNWLDRFGVLHQLRLNVLLLLTFFWLTLLSSIFVFFCWMAVILLWLGQAAL